MTLPGEKKFIKVSLWSNAYVAESTSATIVPFNSKTSLISSTGAFTFNSDGTITCNKAMIISVQTSVYFSAITTGVKTLQICQNDTVVSQSSQYINVKYESLMTNALFLSVAAGDIISVKYTGSVEDTIQNNNSARTYFSIIEI